MGEPHHHVFNALQQVIIRNVKIEPIFPHLIEKKVVPESDKPHYLSKPKNGMKILISYLRNQSFETFLNFVECIFLAQRDLPSKSQAVPVVESIVRAVEDFDMRNQSSHAKTIIAIQHKYLKQYHAEAKVEQSPGTAEVEAIQESMSVSEYEDLPTPTEEAPTVLSIPTVGVLDMMPDLDYVEEPKLASFGSDGGSFTDFDDEYGFSLTVPPMAVPEGKEITLKIGLCCYGPFSISENYLLASDFAVIVADDKFSRPIEVAMDHCLVLPEYRKCSEVVMLKADHLKITEDGLYTFDRFTHPDMLSDSPRLFFETEEFCILCAALREADPYRSSSASSVTQLMSHTHIDDDNPSSAPSSFDDDNPKLQRMRSGESQPPAVLRTRSGSSESGMEYNNESQTRYDLRDRKRKSNSFESSSHSDTSPRKKPLDTRSKRTAMKRARQLERDDSSGAKKHCGIEYAALLIQPKDSILASPDDDSYKFFIFICTNCGVAQKTCLEHATKVFASEPEVHSIPIVFKKALKIKETIIKGPGWTVTPDQSPMVSLSEVQFHTMDRKDMCERIKMKTCPPRILFTVECDDGASRKLLSRITIEGAKTMETEEEAFFNIRASLALVHGNFQRQSAMDVAPSYSHENISPNVSQISTPPGPSPLQACSSAPQTSQQVQDPPVLHSDTQRPRLVLNITSQSSGDQDSPSVQLNVETPGFVVKYISSPPSSDVEKDYINKTPINIGHYETKLRLPEDKELPVTKKNILKICCELKSWKKTARDGFGLSEAQVCQLENDNKIFGDKECAFKSYQQWKMQNGYTDTSGSITLWKMVEILYKSQEFGAIDLLLEHSLLV